MGKRSNFKRMKGDFYVTPESAVFPLIPHIPYGSHFFEPCAGDGSLVSHLEKQGLSCLGASDVEPKPNMSGVDIDVADALSEVGISNLIGPSVDFIITNPPWSRGILHPMIHEFRRRRPTWLLFDADWMHTKQASEYLKHCSKIVSVGRVSWMGNGTAGKDNAAWYLFEDAEFEAPLFQGRAA